VRPRGLSFVPPRAPTGLSTGAALGSEPGGAGIDKTATGDDAGTARVARQEPRTPPSVPAACSRAVAARGPGRTAPGWARVDPGRLLIMWLFLTRRFRTWVLLTFLVPLASGVLRRLGQTLERRNGPTAVSNGLLRAGALGDRTRDRLRGGRKRR